MTSPEISFAPLTINRWRDFEKLFGKRGACGGCWCMYWRLSHSQFEQQKGEANRQSMHSIISAGNVPGLLAYFQNQPIAWCSVAPRQSFPRLERSIILKPVDDQPVWSIVCFFVTKSHRRQGVSTSLISSAVDYAQHHGARIVEGYPVQPSNPIGAPDAFVYTGLFSAFLAAGFVEVGRRSQTRPIMRYYLKD